MKKLLALALTASPLFGMRAPKSVSIIPAHRSCTVALRTFATQNDPHTIDLGDRQLKQAVEIWKATAGLVADRKAAEKRKGLFLPLLATATITPTAVIIAQVTASFADDAYPLIGLARFLSALAVAAGGPSFFMGNLIENLRRSEVVNGINNSALPTMRKVFNDVDPEKWGRAKELMNLAHGDALCEEVESALKDPALVRNKQ